MRPLGRRLLCAISAVALVAGPVIVQPIGAMAAAPVPIAHDDIFVVQAALPAGGQFFIPISELLANDEQVDPATNPVQFAIWSQPRVGGMISPCPLCDPYADWVTYVQTNPEVRTDTFNYVVIDADGDFSVGTVVVLINHLPRAMRDGGPPDFFYQALYEFVGKPVTIPILDNDVDLQDRPLTIEIGLHQGLTVSVGCARDHVLDVTPDGSTGGGLPTFYTVRDADGDTSSENAWLALGQPDGYQSPSFSRPCNDDFDGDFLTDQQELSRPTDPNYEDSDRDSLNDGLETLNGTDPQDPDTDRDCAEDAVDAQPTVGLPRLSCAPIADDDADGIPNAVDNCRNTSNADQADRDRDGVGTACDEPISSVAQCKARLHLTFAVNHSISTGASDPRPRTNGCWTYDHPTPHGGGFFGNDNQSREHWTFCGNLGLPTLLAEDATAGDAFVTIRPDSTELPLQIRRGDNLTIEEEFVAVADSYDENSMSNIIPLVEPLVASHPVGTSILISIPPNNPAQPGWWMYDDITNPPTPADYDTATYTRFRGCAEAATTPRDTSPSAAASTRGYVSTAFRARGRAIAPVWLTSAQQAAIRAASGADVFFAQLYDSPDFGGGSNPVSTPALVRAWQRANGSPGIGVIDITMAAPRDIRGAIRTLCADTLRIRTPSPNLVAYESVRGISIYEGAAAGGTLTGDRLAAIVTAMNACTS